jgi:phenylacetic acid degradation operon negative regulatory protein
MIEVADVALGPRPGTRPQTLVLTFFGNAVLGRNIAVFSGSCLAVMDRLGVSEHATRSTLTRMVQRGLLVRHRRGRKMYFGLTARAVAVLTEGGYRMWHTGAGNRDDEQRWTLLGFSLPESRRDDRHLLRSRLRWAGFGMLRSGLWIAPGIVDVAALVPDRRLLDHVLVFHAQVADPADANQMVRDAYDLPAIAAGYHEFLERWDTPRPLPAAPDALARLMWLLSEWLLLLRDDPRIPLRHLPDDWPAVAAEQVFRRRSAELEPAARRIADAVIDAIEVRPEAA